MRAIVLEAPRSALAERDLPDPVPGTGELLVRVLACGVCRTDLHILDGELEHPQLPLVLGHQVVGEVQSAGAGVKGFAVGDRVGIPWLGWTCNECRYCRSGRENLCRRALFTGYDLDGGYAELARVDARYALGLPRDPTAIEAAPLLCAGMIGFRALRMCGDAEKVGLFGFGASAHIVCQVAVGEGRGVFAITRPGDEAKQAFARDLGATWAGSADELAEPLDAAIIFAPAGELVPVALRSVGPGGSVVCAGIHMSEIPAFAYELLWEERELRSVANLTRVDGEDFLALCAVSPPLVRATSYPLERAREAIEDLRAGRVTGSAVLEIAG